MLAQRLIGNLGKEICIVYHWHRPQAPAVVICPGIANSMSEPRYLLSILARCCYDRGLNVFQFDYLGDGDSSGDYRDVTTDSLLKSANRVMEFAQSLGCEQFGVVGYGVGNIVVSLLGQRPDVHAMILIAPHLLVFSEKEHAIREQLAQLDHAETIYPRVEDNSIPLGMLWKATVGEAIVPAQPCGPISVLFLRELLKLRPQRILSQLDKPVLIISDQDERASVESSPFLTYERIEHNPAPYKPTWHWCVECRQELLDRILHWLATRFSRVDSTFSISVHPSNTSSIVQEDYQPKKLARQCALSFESHGKSLLGILHIPPSSAPLKKMCVIYEPGIPGQRVDIHRCGPRLAEHLAQHGFYVFRYDGRGMGVSEGEFHEFTWTRKLEDTMEIITRLSSLVPTHFRRFIILGNSAGARVACMAANRSSDILATVLWGPIIVEPEVRVGGGSIKRHSSGRLVTEYCGLWLGVNYNIDERKYDFLKELETYRKPSLIIFAEKEENTRNKLMIQSLVSRQPEKDIREMPGTHGFSSECIADVIDMTAKWLSDLVLLTESG